MNNVIFASMREQMCPSEAAQAALWVRLGEASPKPRLPLKKYLAVAACAALVLGAYPVYSAIGPQNAPRLHSYALVEAGDLLTMKTHQQETAELTGDKGAGDRDQTMLPEELVEAMEEAGFATADIDQYQALGYEMTWAKWWKYIHATETPDLESLKAFSVQELSVNTGVLDNPVEDLPAQPGVDGYQLLMDHFGEDLPDWYGGAYVDGRGTLMVLLVESRDPGDKSLETEVLAAVGSIPLGFTSAKYSRSDLNRMNGELLTLLDGKGIFATWGIYDDQNRIVLDVAQPLPDDLLAAIAEIDPDDDAILIRVVEGSAVMTQELMKGPAPIGEGNDPLPGGVQEAPPHSGTVKPEDKESPQDYAAVPNAAPPDDEDLIAIEPRMEELPEKKPGEAVRPASHDLGTAGE